MLVAHLDTVHRETPKNIWFSADYNRVKADEGIGGDDRCGVFAIMHILKNTTLRPNVLFVEDEEIGGIGSNKFIKHYNKTNLDLDYIIEIDRRGSVDSVYYDLDNKDFFNYIDGFGFDKSFGSFTDICTLCPHLGVAGVNLSSGYYHHHTKDEYVVISEMMATRDKIVKILKTYKDKDFRNKFEWKERKYTYYGGYSKNKTYYSPYYYDYGADYYDNYGSNWVKEYNKAHTAKNTNPYYRDPDLLPSGENIIDVDLTNDDDPMVHHKGNCPYCGSQQVMGRDDEYYCFCCDDCAKAFDMKVCKDCGCYSFDEYCETCASYHMILNDKEHDKNDI